MSTSGCRVYGCTAEVPVNIAIAVQFERRVAHCRSFLFGVAVGAWLALALSRDEQHCVHGTVSSVSMITLQICKYIAQLSTFQLSTWLGSRAPDLRGPM